MTLNAIAEKVGTLFIDVDIQTIKNDASEFYRLLELDGFIVSGETLEECDRKDHGFSYKKVKLDPKNRNCSPANDFEKSTQDFFEEYYNNKPQLTNLHIEITSECNERCVHCYIPHENKISSMDSNLFYNILEQCKTMNLLHLTISGGEPMMHSNFIDFLRRCAEYNFSVNILSNLTLLNPNVLSEMKRNPLLSVQVSLYSMDSNIHDAITQVKGSFEKTKHAILSLIENDVPLQISCPIMKQNINCYYPVVTWGKEHNINVGSDYIIIARYNHTTQNLSNRLSVDEIQDVITQRIINEPQYLEELEAEAQKKKDMRPDDFICSVCHSSLCVAENGNVYPCAGWQDYVVGDLNETPLNVIWNYSKQIEYLRNLRRSDFPKCIQCPESEFCTMCMVRNANEHPLGDPLEINKFFCNIAKLNRKMVLDSKGDTITSQKKC